MVGRPGAPAKALSNGLVLELRNWMANVRARAARARHAFFETRAQLSYSQCGEDMILSFLLHSIGIARPSYLDLGAHDPVRLNNTFLFYQRGARGVCVEANPDRAARLARRRPRDQCVHAAIVPEARPTVNLHVTEDDVFSSLHDPAGNTPLALSGMAVERVVEVPALTVAEIAERWLPRAPDLLSIDLEGMDLEVLKSIDLASWRPATICAETLFAGAPGKCRPLIEHLEGQGYVRVADTFVNDLFVDYERWHAIFPLSVWTPTDHQDLHGELEAANFLAEHNLERHRDAERYALSLEAELARQRQEYERLSSAFAAHQHEAERYVASLRDELERRQQPSGRRRWWR